MRHSDSIKELAAALAKAQAAMGGAKKDSNNPAFNSKYADLASIVDAAKQPLADNGLAYVQTPVTADGDRIGVETLLMHASGEWIAGDAYFMPVSKANAHGYGSILTYARRYSLAAMIGIAPEDDDANAGTETRPNTATQVAKDVFDAMDDTTKDYLSSHAKEINRLFAASGDVLGYIEAQQFDTEAKLAIWSLLPSNVRAAIKKAQQETKPPHVRVA